MAQIQVYRDVIQAEQCKRDLAEIGIAGTLTDTIDRALNPVCAATHRGNSRSGSKTEVIVPVEMQRRVGANPATNFADKHFYSLRRTRTDGVDDRDLGSAGITSRRVNLPKKSQVAAGAVHWKEQHFHAVIGRMPYRFPDPTQHFLPVESVGLHFYVAGGNLDQRGGDTQFDQCIEICSQGTRKPPNLGLKTSLEDVFDRLRIGLGHARKAGLNPPYSKL